MQQTSDPRQPITPSPDRGLIQRLFWGKLSRPLFLLLLLMLGSATALALALTGNVSAHWFALAAIAVLAVLIHRMRRRLRFVRHLRDWAERMRGGDLSAKVPFSAETDLDDVIEDINSLGGMLEKLAHEMDAQSHAQTVRLARKTQSLDILYEIAFGLTRPGNPDQQLEGFLDTFIELVDARAATVHLLGNDGQMQLIAGRRFDAAASGSGDTLATHCPHCGWTLTGGSVHILTGSLGCVRQRKARTALDHLEVAVVPVQYQSRTLGVYTLYLDWPVSVLGEDALELLTSIGRHLGLAIEKARLDSDARQLAIMEERNIIGNELHDSLAQSLVSMRLRMKMLGETLHKKDLRAAQNEVRQLRESLDQAHDNLRELLANFRLKIDERGLVPAVEAMAQRFSAETGISVFFHNECRELVLSPQQEIQVYHIIQEALSNIRKHSHAHTARIRIDSDRDGRYTVLIEDDGYGMTPPTPRMGEAEQRRGQLPEQPPEQLPSDGRPGEHIGLSVMQERARRLPGELSIESDPGEGTRVLLSFTSAEQALPTRAADDSRDGGGRATPGAVAGG